MPLAVLRRRRIIGNARAATTGTAIRHGGLKSCEYECVACVLFAAYEQQQLKIVSTQAYALGTEGGRRLCLKGRLNRLLVPVLGVCGVMPGLAFGMLAHHAT